jgi:hypothetical protein
MEMFDKNKIFWKVVVIIAAVALIATSFLPYFALL